MHIFNGTKLAEQREHFLAEKIKRDFNYKQLKIAAILFEEDSGSRLYTKLKKEAATRVGIEYEVYKFSLSNVFAKKNNITNQIIDKIRKLNKDSSITGIIIQKPWRKIWVKAQDEVFSEEVFSQEKLGSVKVQQKYKNWWSSLTLTISEEKDVDGLHPNTISQIRAGTWKYNKKVLPATCRAVLTILDRVGELSLEGKPKKTIIIGKSDLLGNPLYYELLRRNNSSQNKDLKIELIASKELQKRMNSEQKLLDATTIVSATGKKNLITGDMVSENTVIIDVGEPSGDIEFESVSRKSFFITPVPGGVGPMTVVSLLENCVDLALAQ